MEEKLISAARQCASAENFLILSFSNYAFIDLCFNFLAYMKNLRISNLLLVALDERTFDAVEKFYGSRSATVDLWRCHCVCIEKSKAIYSVSEAESFGTVGFRAICNEKPLLVQQLVNAGFDVLWTDTDITWLRDPLGEFIMPTGAFLSVRQLRREHFSSMQSVVLNAHLTREVDMFFQSDDDGVCAGFFLIRSNSETRSFLRTVLEYLNPFIDDQISIRRHLDTCEDVKVVILNRVDFPNGYCYFNLKLPQKLNRTPFIVHNNCIIGHDSKVRRFQQYNLWAADSELKQLLSESSSPSRPAVLISSSPLLHLQSLRGHTEAITSLVVAENNELWSASYDKTLRKWRSGDAKASDIKYLHERGGIWAMRYDRPSSRLFVASHDRTAACWLPANWSKLHSYEGHTTIVNDVDFSDCYVFTCSDDGTARCHDIVSGERVRIYIGHTDCVTALRCNSVALFTASADGTARAWHISSARCMVLYQGHGDWVTCLDITENELYTGSRDGTARKWDMRSGVIQLVVQCHAPVLRILVEAQVLICALGNGNVALYSCTSGNCIGIHEGAHGGAITAMIFDKDERRLFTGGVDKVVQVWHFKHS